MEKLIATNRGDVDIDFSNRNKALENLVYIPASIIKDNKIAKHNTGVYFHIAPIDPITNLCSIDYINAENKGMFKIDMLNVSVYDDVRDEDHLIKLMNTEPPWEKLWTDSEFVEKLVHVGRYYTLLQQMRPNSILKMAMFLALIRPGKKHLRGKSWNEIEKTIWEKSDNGQYGFHKSHSVAYATLVAVHMNILNEKQFDVI